MQAQSVKRKVQSQTKNYSTSCLRDVFGFELGFTFCTLRFALGEERE